MTLAGLRSSFTGRIITDPTETAPFLTDWRKQWSGAARAVLQPECADDVAAAVRWCAQHCVPIVPQGGNTGLSGGATPDQSGNAIVLSLARMNRIRKLDPANDTITVDAGCLLANVQAAAAEAGRMFPLSLAAEGSCTIGGNLATNAGGTAVLRYGNARELCLGLEVVTAEGSVWDGLSGLRKDNSGYSLQDIYIGSEGTLGIITGAVLKLFPQPAGRIVAFGAVETVQDAVVVLQQMRIALDCSLTAFELISRTSLSIVLDHLPGRRRPVAADSPWYVLIEVSYACSEERAQEDLETALGVALLRGQLIDSAVSATLAQSTALWELRHAISEAQAAAGRAIKHDVSVPISAIAEFIAEANAAIVKRWPQTRLVTFGHIGDGNLHYNLSPPAGDDGEVLASSIDEINRTVHDIVMQHGGSISAEHGLGQLRAREAARYKGPVELDLMRRVKSALDPSAILNPGKVL